MDKELNSLEYDVLRVINNCVNTCQYGLGRIGNNIAEYLFSCLGLKIDYYSDSDINRSFQVKGKWISKQDLLSSDIPFFIVVTTGEKAGNDIKNELSQNKKLIIYTFTELYRNEYFIKSFYELNRISIKPEQDVDRKISHYTELHDPNSRIAVYTCIIGRYDELKTPLFIDDKCDYYLISDKKPENDSIYKWVDVRNIVPEEYQTPTDINRYCKMHGSLIFKDYRYSVYHDGNVRCVGKIPELIDLLSDCGFVVLKHEVRSDVYEEGVEIAALGMSNISKVIQQIQEYYSEGLPLKSGLCRCGIVVRDHMNENADKIMNYWFDEYIKKIKRDQISLPYVLYKFGVDIREVYKLGFVADDKHFEWSLHLK